MLYFFQNSAGAPEIDTNNYYPFGLNHIGGGNSSNFGSFNSYKYNGKELQETGFYDYGARMYMSDLGRWGVIDPLAEISRRFSPYNYAFNNPVMFIDPDGRRAMMPFSEGQGSFGGSGGSLRDAMTGRYNRLGGLGYGTLDNTPHIFGETQTFTDLMSVMENGGDFSLKTKNGYMSWWTGGALGDANTAQEMIGHMLRLNSYEYDSDIHKLSQDLRKWSGYAYSANKFVFQPAADRALLYGAGEAYSTTNLVFEKVLPKILGSRRIYVPLMEVSVKNAQRLAIGTRVAGAALGIAGIGLGIYDMTENGVNMSNSLDTVMSVLAVSPTGWGQAIAGTYFLANGITTLVTGKDIGQHIEGAVNKYYNDGVRAEEQRKFNAAMGY
ncbi:RHS repeat-associated core domain-containing protein [Chryseobacterium sp. G0240]|uniref:RHS repeat-associated core domain-containing protein n=1 Tax=Chryseobacterium sp. G0240 TaxID=2487066 RepID=UPI000F45C3DD|nr:RHS repeat-associated core domain-containing protein [Chryseobacterium sp. G0240]